MCLIFNYYSPHFFRALTILPDLVVFTFTVSDCSAGGSTGTGCVFNGIGSGPLILLDVEGY